MRYALLLLRCCLLLGAAWLPFLSLAQVTVDSTRSSYTEEHVSYSEEVVTKPLKRPAKPLGRDTTALRVQREDRDLWKLGLNNVIVNDGYNGFIYRYYGYRRFGLHLAYERKLHRPAWSILAEVSPAILRTQVYTGYSSDVEYRWGVNVRAQLAGRYYYNLERRIRQGRGAGNFSANYFSLALGTGIGRYTDTPFIREVQHGQSIQLDGALLYGIQRRLGKYGFVDVNAGVVSLFTGYNRGIQPGGSLRIGLALGAAPTQYAPSLEDDAAAKPRAYVGAQAGVYGYYIRSKQYYSSLGAGIGPYVYAGYYLRPRLAVQVGLQYQYNETSYGGQSAGPDTYSNVDNYEHTLAMPVLLRYGLTKRFTQRVQFDAVGGAALLTGIVHYQSNLYKNQQLISQSEGREQNWAVNPMVGLDVSYGFGRKRQLQATIEGVVIKSLFDGYYNTYGYFRPGVSVGLRYRFNYL